jgi:phosphate acetyltransferase
MDIIKSIRERASQKQKTIVLPRSSDDRVVKAAEYLTSNNLCKVILLKNKNSAATKLPLIEPEEHPNFADYASAFYEKRKHKGLSQEQARKSMRDPLYFAAAMLSGGDAHGCVAGSVSTTGDVLRAAIQVVGLKPGSSVVSSTFLMSFADGKVFTFGDCAVVPYPTSEQLASIAVDSAETHRLLTGEEARVALLSFSTKGSAKHEMVDLVVNAGRIARTNQPELALDGELQFDAAFIESIGSRKAPGSPVAGKANTFIFPNLDAGNIGYKLTERLAGATATGPVIQGLAKPMMDLSRGCSWEDIVNTACVAALMS